MKSKNPYWYLYSKVKDICIELPSYNFFHSPAEIIDIDQRFIGRSRISDRLKNILNNSESSSGAYLITGYRGMGKTSFVNKVLSESLPFRTLTLIFPRYFTPILILIFTFIGIQLYNGGRIYDRWESFIECILLGYALFNSIKLYPCLKYSVLYKKGKLSRRIGHPIVIWIKGYFLTNRKSSSVNRSENLTKQFVAATLIIYFSISENHLRLHLIVECFFLYLFINVIFLKAQSFLKSQNKGFMKELWNDFYNSLQKSLGFTRKIYININLGYDNLKEINVLRLIAGNLDKYYDSVSSGFWLSKIVLRCIQLIFLLLLFFARERDVAVKSFYDNIIVDSKIYQYFPSQIISLTEEGSLKNYFKKGNLSYSTYSAFVDSAVTDEINRGLIKQDLIYPNYNSSKNSNHKDPISDSLETFKAITISTDFIIQLIYHSMANAVRSDKPHRFEKYIPSLIEYFPLLTVLSIYFVFILFTKYLNWGTFQHRNIRRRLRELNDSIEAQVLRETAGSLNINQAFGFSNKKSMSYKEANERTIEKEILEILHDIHNLKWTFEKRQFVFIFDELDKIEPSKVLDDNHPSTTSNDTSYSYLNSMRGKQKKILEMLLNLKPLLTSAKAKFILIAGREMFDTALADVSDRNSFIGSIFHDVIYVNSFLTDSTDKRSYDITNMTEAYVCQFIVPQEFPCEKYDLESFNHYLEITLNKNEQRANQLRIQILFTIRNFITYLTYRSNGVPKKITSYFESYIVSREMAEKNKIGTILITRNLWSKSNDDLYLCFRFYDQYTFGMATFLVNPFFLSLNRSMKDYGDKLLVSSAFLVDHLYKFHKVGFSWSNLETMPELLDINRAPQTREIIINLVQFLSHTHIQQVDSALYDFKFTKRISEEISFLSKISERESAAYNFTLDESISTKQYFQERLSYLESISEKKDSKTTILAVVHLRDTLGDLYFYDEEYDDAIDQYLIAIQGVEKNINGSDITELFHTKLQLELKIGLSYEKKKMYDYAFINYGRASEEVLNWYKKNKKMEYGGYSPLEGTRIYYQPLLSMLQVIEKSHFGGITMKDVEKVVGEYKKLSSQFNKQKNVLLDIDFYNKLGDILFFKNGPQYEPLKKNNQWDKTLPCRKNDSLCVPNVNVKELVNKDKKIPCVACRFYMEALRTVLNDLTNSKFDLNKYPKSAKAVFEVLIDVLKEEPTNPIEKKAVRFKAIANNLSDVGNTFLSCSSSKEKIRPKYLEKLTSLINLNEYSGRSDAIIGWNEQMWGKLTKIEEAILYFYIAAVYYMYGGEYEEYSFQLTKIINIIRENKEKYSDTLINSIGNSIVKRGLRGYFRTYENTHFIEIEKMQRLTSTSLFPQSIKLNRYSINWEIDEILRVYFDLDHNNLEKLVQSRLKAGSALLTDNYSMYNRILNLWFLVKTNYLIFQDIDRPEIINININVVQLKKLIQDTELPQNYSFDLNLIKAFLITDSIFCFVEIIKACKIYGASYVVNHTLIARAHNKLAYWCSEYKKFRSTDINIQSLLLHLLSESDLETLNENYQYEMALRHYRFALETHKQGKMYNDFLQEMYFLNDDFNDNLYHFSAAKERNRINSNKINISITQIKQKLTESKYYKPAEYR